MSIEILWFEHFDLYGGTRNELLTRGYDSFPNANSTLDAATPRNGSHAFRIFGNANDQRLRRALPAGVAKCGLGTAIRRTTNGILANTSIGLRLDSAANTYHAIINANNGITLYRGSTVIDTSDPTLIASDAWVFVEMQADSVGGTVEVRIGPDVVCSATGETFGDLTHWSVGKTNGIMTGLVDDIVVWKNTGSSSNWLGDTFVLIGAPNSDDTPMDFTASTGSSEFAMIDEATINDADYILGSAVGNISRFGCASVTLPTGAVAAVAIQTRALKTDAGASSIKIGITSDGTDSNGGDNALATSALSQTHIANTDPDGSVPWTAAAANAALLRMERTA